ncbi:putative bifunctional diguanylate cyclase/phosphodiesterase [Saccharospirillum impatiens]|uniref:putative bifunctional diguanylate cyclase/phosphodiesterase n=1 Tax=Saccharospirillum impatiens TaxID=169438 RepID=UPI0003FCF9E9|nr:EAL domain-containing protein [Saccharospirillum impatiens]
MTISFRTRLLLIFTAVLAVTLTATTLSALRATDANTRTNALRELAVAERVFQTLLDENSRELTDRTTLLAEDFGFRQAIATNEEDTIISVLANHGDRIGADLIMLMSPEGEVLISTHDIGADLDRVRSGLGNQATAFSLLTLSEHQPYQMVMVPVDAPQRVAWVGMGFLLDSDLLNRFRDITSANVTLIYRERESGNDSDLQTLSTLPTQPLANVNLLGPYEEVLAQASQELLEQGLLSRYATLLDQPPVHLGALLTVSLADAVAANTRLRTQMLLIALAALVAAAVVTLFIARGITRPIDTLVAAARRIARGDYQQGVSLKNTNEFGVLGQTLNTMQNDIQQRERHIFYQAQHDLKTGLPNLEQMAQRFAEKPQDDPQNRLAVVLIRLENVSALSDVYGLAFTDEIVRLAAERLVQQLRPGDVAGRVGPNEFLVLADAVTTEACDQALADYLAVFDRAIGHLDIDVVLDVRMGLVMCPEHAQNFEDALRRANIAVSDARLHGQSLERYQSGRDESHLRQLTVTNRLQHAIEHGGFELLFQPQYDLRNRRIHSAEALLRWHDEQLGRMFPDEFIPLAEQSGDITQITEWVVTEAIAQMTAWRSEGFDMGVSINLSARDILNRNFIDRVIERTAHAGFERKHLMLEITESAMVTDTELALSHLKRLFDAGFDLAMDDFGTGYSSLAQLKTMPIHELKIDKSFVLQLDEDQDDQNIVRATIEMAHHLGLTVIAEGVENLAALTLLEQMGCDAIQGYYLSKPMAVSDLKPWLAAFKESKLELNYG